MEASEVPEKRASLKSWISVPLWGFVQVCGPCLAVSEGWVQAGSKLSERAHGGLG